jgi:putative metallohydrolase (TIGR04338 family)
MERRSERVDMELLQHDENVRSHDVEKRLGKILDISQSEPRPFANYFAPGSMRWWRKGKCPKRDSFRQRSYEAEHAFRSKIEFKTFTNIAEVARYVREVMEKPFFQRRFPLFQSCLVKYIPKSSGCRGGPREYNKPTSGDVLPDDIEVTSGGIEMSTRGMYNMGEVAVLHELAHAVIPFGHCHDRRWARTFIEFVGCAMGFTFKKMLMEEFRNRRIPFSPVRKEGASVRNNILALRRGASS